MLRTLRLGALVLSGTLLLSACNGISGGAYDLPLPGGADLGDNAITISADFDDALDLVPQSSVKVDNVAVGRVSKITLNKGGQSAHVVIQVNGGVALPVGTKARLQQTSLLGEKYVALVRPSDVSSQRRLRHGDNLGLADTSQSAEVEQVLGALSMVLNGGGIEKFQQISRELQKISTGRPDEIKGFLRQMEGFVAGLDSRKQAITAAIDGLARLSQTLDGDKAKIAKALEELSPGMQVIVDQREQLVAMLSSLDRLSKVTVRTMDAAQDDIVADFEALAPVLRQLAKAGSDLPNSLQMLLTYPFPDSVLGAIKGDYLNVFITTNFRTLPTGCAAMGCVWPQVSGSNPARAMVPGPKTYVAPSLLPSTSSPAAGVPSPTMLVPTSSPSASESGQPSPGPSPTATSSSPAPGVSTSPDASGSPSPHGPASADPTGGGQ